MGKQNFKPGNMLYPLPVVLVTTADKNGNTNVFTVAWAGTVCSDPPMVSISVRPQRFSHHMIMETGEFVINLTTEKLTYATDFCGVRSGKDIDKFKEMDLTRIPAAQVIPPLIKESPVNIECKVTQTISLGSHDMFLAQVVAVHGDEAYMDVTGRFFFNKSNPIVYSHGTYYSLGKEKGSFGYSVRKNPAQRTKSNKNKTSR